MSTPNWKAVFLAEYYTTTSKFRKYRSHLPWIFIFGVVFFSYFLRSVIDFISGDVVVNQPPIERFYAIISIFSFFTFFAPIVSPLGRVVYDGNAQSRREVALSAPVKPHELLYGNLLSNLVFFLPFYVMVGTASLSVFVGSGTINPLLSSLHIIGALTLLVIMGLFGGTIITPLILNFIAKQRNEVARSVVTVLVAVMLMVSLPMLQFIITNLEGSGSLGLASYLPFTMASTIIVYAIYGQVIGLNLGMSYIGLVVYTMVIVVIGYFIAERLYRVNESTMISAKSTGGMTNSILRVVARPIPSVSVREIFIGMVKGSVRDIEHMSRLTIGLAGTIFFVYALSPRGLFRGQRIATIELERAAVLFALILSASMTIYIEAASFLIQHRSMLTLIKSSPGAPRKFVIAKLLEMIFIQTPVFVLMFVLLRVLDFSADLDLMSITIQIFVLIFCMTGIILGIYLLNPSDNEEDITNFINLLIFYAISLMIASFPIAQSLGFSPGFLPTFLFYVAIILLAIGLVSLGIKALNELNIETMSSDFSEKVALGFTATIVTLASWNLLPLPAYLIYFSYPNPILLVVLTLTLPLVTPAVFWIKHGLVMQSRKIRPRDIAEGLASLFALMVVGYSMVYLASLITNFSAPSILQLLIDLRIELWMIVTYVFVSVLVEELFFRGFLMDYLKGNGMSIKWVIVLSASIFSLFHILSVISFLFAIFGGIILGVLKERSEGVVIPFIVHLVYNLSIVLISI